MRLGAQLNFSPCKAAAACVAAMIAGCSNNEDAFSQRDGFDAIRALQGGELPSPADRSLLERHAPRLFVSEGTEGPLDFYGDYIAHGRLDAPGQQTDHSVSREDLQRVKHDPDAVFEHIPSGEPVTHVAYGSVYRRDPADGAPQALWDDWTFLRYHFAFRTSGIAMGVRGWKKLLLAAAGDFHDWHQLDHYTAVVVALDESDAPTAVMLQQHNYMRTYLVGADPAFPAGGPFMVDAAQRSNELYPHRDVATMWRAASFLSADTAAWLAGVTDEMPTLGTYDRTSPDREVGYQLRYLPPNDAFYVFEGRLGDKRMMPGRDGPPGAIYYTLPELWRYEVALPMFYWREGDQQFADLYGDMTWASALDALAPQRRRLEEALRANGLAP